MPSIKPADEFSDGWGNYIVLPYEAVDWSGVAHGDSNKPCVGAATGGPVQTARGCRQPVVWIVLDFEGVAWPLCEKHGDTDNVFFAGDDARDPFLKPVNEDLTPTQRAWAWGENLPVYGPLMQHHINNSQEG